MDIPAVTPEQVFGFAAVVIVPAIVDILRVGIFQIALRLNWQYLAELTTHSKFGVYTTMIVCLGVGLILSLWLDVAEPTWQSIAVNSFAILGVSQGLYKLGYEKSDTRKTVTSVMDKIGVQSVEIDTPDDQVAVG